MWSCYHKVVRNLALYTYNMQRDLQERDEYTMQGKWGPVVVDLYRLVGAEEQNLALEVGLSFMISTLQG